MNLLQQAQRLLAIAQSGLTFGKDPYDHERYTEVKQIALTLLADCGSASLPTIEQLFSQESGYPTPKIDVRGFCLNEQHEILLVQDATSLEWSLPGGFGEVGFSPRENIEKEMLEETGYQVDVSHLLAVFDTNLNLEVPQSFQYYKLVFACHLLDGAFRPNIEVRKIAYFPLTQLPRLSEKRTTKEQLTLLSQQTSLTYFD
ncbi:NUDIX hydrolase [Enterococcus sp. LJL98]